MKFTKSRKKKIIFFYKNFNTYGGAEKLILELNKLYKNENLIITQNFDTRIFKKPDNLIITKNFIRTLYSLLKLTLKHKLTLVTFSGFSDIYLLKFILRFKFIVVYFTPLIVSYDEQTKFYFPIKKRFLSFIKRSNTHNLENYFIKQHGIKKKIINPLISLVQYNALKNSNYLITLSDFSSLEKKIIFKHENVMKINGAFSKEKIRNYPLDRIDKNNKNLVCVARLDRHKNIEKLITEFSLIQDDYNLTIIGDGPLKNEIINLIKVKKLDEKITLTGFIDEIKLNKYLQTCFAFISLDIGDYKLTMFEALILHKHVIINKYYMDDDYSDISLIHFYSENLIEICKKIKNFKMNKKNLKELNNFLNKHTFENYYYKLNKII